jgi:hypothetical protein
MQKKLTRAMRREVVRRLFLTRKASFEERYVKRKTQEAVNLWLDEQEVLESSIINITDHPIGFKDFTELLEGNGFEIDASKIFGELLSEYSLELEEIFLTQNRQNSMN